MSGRTFTKQPPVQRGAFDFANKEVYAFTAGGRTHFYCWLLLDEFERLSNDKEGKATLERLMSALPIDTNPRRTPYPTTVAVYL